MIGEFLTWALLAEVLFVASVILYLVFFVGGRRKKTDHKAIQTLTKKIKTNVAARKEKVGEDGAFSSFNDKLLDELFVEVQQKESKMYQQIVRIFLKRDAEDLKTIDVHLDGMSAPFWKALKEVIEQSQIKMGDADLSSLNSELAIALNEKERLSEQLVVALRTLDDVSNEYANMFEGKKEQEELRSSKDRVMDHFYQALQEGNWAASQQKDRST